jgi:oxygen-independent coproporphyrinogen-3 oxidase
LHRWVEQGRLPEPDSDLAADMYDFARVALADAGFHHYEISNWCLTGLESEHNLAYWRNLQWLGVGPGAHSSLTNVRFWTMRSPREYARRAQEWAQAAMAWQSVSAEDIRAVPTVDDLEVIDQATAAAETMFLGLRLLDGMDPTAASARIGIDLTARYRRELAELTAEGLLVWQADGRLRLAEEAYLVANQVFTRFLVK